MNTNMSISDLITWIKNFFKKEDKTALQLYTKEYLEYFDHLFSRAANANGFSYLYTILRVEGMTSGHWDAFVEAEDTAMDFSKLLRKMGKKEDKRKIRMALFLYCHSTEMSVPYEVVANLLRVSMDQPYKMYPFAHLIRVEKSKTSIFAKRHLPYPKQKIKHIKELASAAGEEKISEIFDGFFRNDVRNAFYHSDYTITDDEFRIIQGGEIGKEVISLEEISEILARCFAFYSAFFITYNRVRKGLAEGQRYQRMPNYEVLELLSDKDEGLTGFKIHFPNGGHAMFERKKYEGTTGINFMIEEEGISLNVGELSSYKNATGWFVEGKPFVQLGTRYNRVGHWYPIVFNRNAQPLQTKAHQATTDKVVQGCLFYIYATGHMAVEFVIKSQSALFEGDILSLPFSNKKKSITVHKVAETPSGMFIYDATFHLEKDDPTTVRTALDEIEKLIAEFKIKDGDLRWRLKYQLYSSPSDNDIEPNDDGSFTIVLSMDDPRHTMVASNLTMFPKSDWKIKEAWI